MASAYTPFLKQNIFSTTWYLCMPCRQSMSNSLVNLITYFSLLLFLSFPGYGNITPRTAPGQIGAIVYAIFGIPLTLLTLKSFGKLCNSLMKYFITMVEKCVTKQPEIQNLEVKVLVLNIVALNAVIFISAIVSCYKDGWEMREGVYVWFITFTTVGFGDLIPTMMMQGFQPNSSIIPGLCFMSGVVDAMVECVTCLKVFPCRGNFFSWIFCCNCCGSYHVNNAIENLEAPGNPLRNFGSEESNGFQESGNSSLAK